jgi:N-ethylmaleimide reductase
VHDHGGVIFAQLWHTGRVGHSVDRNGALPVAPSGIMVEGAQHFTSQGMKDFETPRPLSIEEIERTIQDYKQAALNAREAGFDGVELHAANGYLPNQFIADSSNQRTDKYGGSIENKSRFILEVMKALIDAVGAKRVSIKISPLHSYAGVVLEDPIASYSYLIEELNKLDFTFLEIMKRSPMFPFVPHYPEVDEIALFGGLSKHTVVANTGYTRESGEAELNNGIAQLISYGVSFLANPDLPVRFEQHAKLNRPDLNTMFGGTDKGYTDYPFLEK